ncbi:MAG TPA: MFS transporter [Acetobacteraceae bacterium]|jgi:MFS family permease|nr:MFS transporter [Acetobacteraceae bacterium]
MTAALARLCSGRIHYAWIALAVAFTVTLGAVGVRAAPGVIIVPLERAFGWSVGTISAAISLNILLLGLTGPFTTGLMETLGLRRTILLCLTLLLVGTGLSTFITAPWQLFFTWGLLVGVGSSAGAVGMAAAVANRWFVAHRGLAMGLLSSANAAGQLIFLPILGRLSQDYGWQSVSITVTLTIAVLIPLAALLLPESPAAIGLGPLGAVVEPPAPPRAGNPFSVAMDGLIRGARSLDFWLLALSFGICGFSTNGLIGTHLIAFCVDHGYSQFAGAGILASLGVFSLIGSAISGWLTDRFNPRILLFWIFGLRGLSLLLLPYTSFDTVSLTVFAVFYGLDWIAVMPPIFALVNDVFGRKSAPVIMSWIFATHQIGGATAAVGAGIVRTWTGSYLLAFLASGLACLLASMLVLRIAPTQPALAVTGD